jgi:hypothetical protein
MTDTCFPDFKRSKAYLVEFKKKCDRKGRRTRDEVYNLNYHLNKGEYYSQLAEIINWVSWRNCTMERFMVAAFKYIR